MPAIDADRWNARYRQGWHAVPHQPREILKCAEKYLPHGGLVLDLAMGIGLNAWWLMKHNYRVVGVDISSEAVFCAKQRNPELMAIIADLSEYYFPSKAFSAVLNFYFLDRSLLRDFARILVPNGIAVVESLTTDMLEIKPELPENFLLNKGELEDLFSGWTIHFYQEGWQSSDHGGKKAIASIIAQLPDSCAKC